jgi:hypothetical protein
VLSDPRLPLLYHAVIVDHDESLEVREREWVQIEAADEKAAAVDRRNLRVEHRLVPLVDADALGQESPIETTRRCASERDVAAAGEE